MKLDETKTYTITASPDVHRRLERFLALLHYNAGHSAIFGMQFDGDGQDRVNVDPAPDVALAQPAQRIGSALDGLEYVGGDGNYRAVPISDRVTYRYREFPAEGIDQLQRRHAGDERGTIVQEWPRSAPDEK